MGTLEYFPSKNIPKDATTNLDEVVTVLEKVLSYKADTKEEGLSSSSLFNIFKIGTSAGGARPKVLISERKDSHQIIPGDLEYSDAYNHFLVKLSITEDLAYSREAVEYAYYLTFSLNPMLNVVRNNRVLSINNKRTDFVLNDLLTLAEKFTIKNPRGIIEEVQSVATFWQEQLYAQGLPNKVIQAMVRYIQKFEL